MFLLESFFATIVLNWQEKQDFIVEVEEKSIFHILLQT